MAAIVTNPKDRRYQSAVAMTVALVSWGMLFAALFLGWFLVRFNAPTWPPVELEGLPQALPLGSSLVMALSSWTFLRHERGQGKNWLYATIALGAVFLGMQWALWGQLRAMGVLVQNGMVSSMVYAFTWLHAGHIVLGLMGLGWLALSAPSAIKTENVGKFWHFLGVVWLLMYLMLFVF